jgi:hypothetical protein
MQGGLLREFLQLLLEHLQDSYLKARKQSQLEQVQQALRKGNTQSR